MTTTTKRCRRCHEVKDLSQFRVDPRKKDGHYATCKGCVISRADIRRLKRPPVVRKVCRTCKQEKPNEAFGVDRQMKDGLRADCRACRKIAGHEYYSSWPEERKTAARERTLQWEKDNPVARKTSYIKSMRRRKYGIEESAYQAMLVEHDHKCAICRREETVKTNGVDIDNLCVDHDHTTGKTRGLLCARCNKAIGLFADDPERLERAVAYLRKHGR